jgi:hypothetical protein
MTGRLTTVKELKSIEAADFQIILNEILAAGPDAIVA